MFEPGVEESGARRSREVELYGLITSTTKLAKQRFNGVACLLVQGVQGFNPRKGDEIPPLFITHSEIHDVDGTFGLLQCTMDYTDHMLHAHTDRDPSSNDWSVLRAMTPMKEKGHVEHAGTSGV